VTREGYQILNILDTSNDGALSNLVWWRVSLPMAGGLEIDHL